MIDENGHGAEAPSWRTYLNGFPAARELWPRWSAQVALLETLSEHRIIRNHGDMCMNWGGL
jgi:hypothetical protein